MKTRNTALAVIDVQIDYFPGGRFPLWRAGRALRSVCRCLDWARSSGIPIVFIKHESLWKDARFLKQGTPGTALHPALGVRDGERVVLKHEPDSFMGADLEVFLRSSGITRVIWTGMITWMCVDTTVRSSTAKGFENVLVTDATASGWLIDRRGPITPWSSQRRFIAALGARFARLMKSRVLTAQKKLDAGS
jgi:nicotinamidase-related amidase